MTTPVRHKTKHPRGSEEPGRAGADHGGGGTDTPPAAGGGGGSTLERVTVNLSPRSVRAMEQLVASTGDTKTDVINKALQVYSFIQEVMDEGGRLYTREAGSDELERLRFM